MNQSESNQSTERHAPGAERPLGGKEDKGQAKLAILKEELAIHKIEREMASVESELEHEMQEFEADELAAERQIEQRWRAGNFGRDPERPPRWPNHGA